MKIRKFEILDVVCGQCGPGPDRAFNIRYRGIVKKQWVERSLWVVARNKEMAIQQAKKRFGGKN